MPENKPRVRVFTISRELRDKNLPAKPILRIVWYSDESTINTDLGMGHTYTDNQTNYFYNLRP